MGLENRQLDYIWLSMNIFISTLLWAICYSYTQSQHIICSWCWV